MHKERMLTLRVFMNTFAVGMTTILYLMSAILSHPIESILGSIRRISVSSDVVVRLSANLWPSVDAETFQWSKVLPPLLILFIFIIIIIIIIIIMYLILSITITFCDSFLLHRWSSVWWLLSLLLQRETTRSKNVSAGSLHHSRLRPAWQMAGVHFPLQCKCNPTNRVTLNSAYMCGRLECRTGRSLKIVLKHSRMEVSRSVYGRDWSISQHIKTLNYERTYTTMYSFSFFNFSFVANADEC